MSATSDHDDEGELAALRAEAMGRLIDLYSLPVGPDGHLCRRPCACDAAVGWKLSMCGQYR
jgi:hypothetical protein